MQDYLSLLQNLDLAGYLLLAVAFLPLIFARYLVVAIYKDSPTSPSVIRKTRILRVLSILVIVAYIYFFTQDKKELVSLKILGVLGIIYLAYLLSHISAYFIIRGYGKERDVDNEKRFIETYNSRLLSILSSVFISIMALIAIIQLLELDSLLEAGGVIGFIGVLLALTNGVWAPDIFSGLIILNSDMLDEGDIIELHDNKIIYGKVHKTKLFHTVILSLVDNHRIMLRNSRLRDFTVHNLSKFASAKGLRESLAFKIAYDVPAGDVRKLFRQAFERVKTEGGFDIEVDHGFDLGIHEAGDHAVEWRLYYYTKGVDRLPRTRQQLNEVILQTANANSISLSTPLTHTINSQFSPGNEFRHENNESAS